MDMGLKGRTAVICGASKGLGKACAEAFAAEGVNLVICSRNFERIFATARYISETYGVDVVPIAADLNLPETSEKLAREAVGKFESIDILVNNNGGPPAGTFENIKDKEWAQTFEQTLMSAVRMSRAVIPHMALKKWGRIINLTSIAVKQPIRGLILSNSLRSAIIGMAKTLAAEVAPSGILVNNIATGNFDTERLRSLFKIRSEKSGRTEEEETNELLATIPLGRLGQPEELASLVVYLASERASYITGTTIQIDGGVFSGLM